MNLADWLLEQIVADGEVARAATPGPWESAPVVYGPPDDGWGEPTVAEVVSPTGEVVAHQHYEGGGSSLPDAAHIARWDPARVLAECTAKRRVVKELTTTRELVAELIPHGSGRLAVLYGFDAALRALAQPYRDRAGYRQEWDVQ